MIHNPLNCIWRRWFRPFIISGAIIVGKPPKDSEYTENMKKLALEYLYTYENFEDFLIWLYNKKEQKQSQGQIEWLEYFETDNGELVNSPMVEPTFIYCNLFVFAGLISALIGWGIGYILSI